MIYYQSTRSNNDKYSFSEAILKPLSNDGGLLVPSKIPHFSQNQLKTLLKSSYQECAAFVFELFQTDLSKDVIKKIVKEAYSDNFSTQKIAPIVKLKNEQYVLELWYGPTSAFKDIALQIVPLLLQEGAKLDNSKRIKKQQKPLDYLVLVVTTGDTGKAALEGFKDKKGFSIITFYPKGNVSQLQELQMTTQEGKNVFVYASQGDVDLTDTVVKDIYKDSDFVQKLLQEYSVALSSANSTNWARIIPQITYYINSYIELLGKRVIKLGDEIDVAVPTGSFGNILSAFYAKKMGLPIRKLVCASNENNIVTEFLRTGIYDSNKHTLIATPSNSMDTLIAYNIERLLFAITENTEKVASWMHNLHTKGNFEIDSITKKILQNEFYADWVSSKDCLENVNNIYNETGYLMDPHTSVAQKVVDRYLASVEKQIPILIVSTAHWAKFPKSTYAALKGSKNLPLNEFRILDEIKKLTPNIFIPKNLIGLQSKTVKHSQSCKPIKEDIEKIILNNLATNKCMI